jgi:hypothetical protein
MRIYVNPPGESKEAFLQREGVQCKVLHWQFVPKGKLPVVLVDNPAFSAAGIAYTESALEEFTRESDTRPKRYYLVPIASLLDTVLPAEAEILKEVRDGQN